jgi:Flp pilus assembly protein TadD
MLSLRLSRLVLPIAVLTSLALAPDAALAQGANAKPVVQPLPPSEVTDLKDALRVLQRKPRDLEALLNAGYASLKVNDLDAAKGFFARAEQAAPSDPRVKQGQASVALRAGNPINALELFASAEAAGAPPREVLSDRGLAYDMVGDQVRAQAHYRMALSERPSDAETIRRLAVSQAIDGNQLAFEDTLRPLIDQQDPAAFRARAFGMAILGEQDRAEAVTRELIPKNLADKIIPFLKYMPRLTKAQQAAAANLGIFPVPKDIGRDNPKIASFAGESAVAVAASGALARVADSRLEPTGEPLGRSAPAASQPSAPAPTPTPAIAVRPVPVQDTVVVVMPGTREPGAGANALAAAQATPVRSDVPAPGFDLASTGARPVVATPAPAPTPAPRISPKPAPSFADAFADLGPARVDDVAVVGNAVNIKAIDVPREAAPKSAPPKVAPKSAPKSTPKPTPAKAAAPAHPRRYWVQLGTGAEAAALRFDWRRLNKKVPDLLGKLSGHTAPFNAQHRLLAGPFESEAKRDEVLKALTAKGLGVLPYTSPEGTVIQKLE